MKWCFLVRAPSPQTSTLLPSPTSPEWNFVGRSPLRYLEPLLGTVEARFVSATCKWTSIRCSRPPQPPSLLPLSLPDSGAAHQTSRRAPWSVDQRRWQTTPKTTDRHYSRFRPPSPIPFSVQTRLDLCRRPPEAQNRSRRLR